MSQRTSYLLVDGENIDATLGTSVLGRRPHPEERPRWNKLLGHLERRWQQPVKALFFLAVDEDLPMSFVQALRALGYTPVPLSGSSDEKVVDIAIQRTLEALGQRDDDVMLVSHDGDFLEAITPLMDGERRVGLIAFEEFRNSGFTDLVHRGMEFYDLEHDTRAFNSTLPRLRIIPIEEFDPVQFL